MTEITYDGPGELRILSIERACQVDKSYFDRVITVCQDDIEDNVPDDIEYSFYNMADGDPDGYGGSAEYDLFEEAADELYDALSDDETVLIHCHRGRSRSVSVAVGALSRLLDVDVLVARGLISDNRYVHPNQTMFDHARRYGIDYDSTETT